MALIGLSLAVLVAGLEAWRYWPVDYWRTTDSVPVTLSPLDAQAVAVQALAQYGGVPPGAGPPQIARQLRVTLADGPRPSVLPPRVMQYVFLWSPSDDAAARDVLTVSVDSYPVARCNERSSATNERETRWTCHNYTLTFGATVSSIRRRWVPGVWRAVEQWRARTFARPVTIAGPVVDSCANHSLNIDAFRRVVGASNDHASDMGMNADAGAEYVRTHTSSAIAPIVPVVLAFPRGQFAVTRAIVRDHGDGHDRELFLLGRFQSEALKEPWFVNVSSADHEPVCREHTAEPQIALPESHTIAEISEDAVDRAREEIEDDRFMSSPSLPITVRQTSIKPAGTGTELHIEAAEGRVRWHDRFTYSGSGWLQRADFIVDAGARAQN